MSYKKHFGAVCFFICLNITAFQTTFAQATKGLYVDNFFTIIQDKQEQLKLLEMSQSLNINYLILYDMGEINNSLFSLNDSIASLPLAQFISLAKNTYGIKNVGVIAEKVKVFHQVVAYNNFYALKPSRRINYLNLEFEFWNPNSTGDSGVYCSRYLKPAGKSCSIENAFEYYKILLTKVDSLANTNGLKSETYIGNVDSAQCVFIGQHVDRVLLHHYRQSDLYDDGTSIYQYKNERYKYLTANSNKVTVMPIFASTDEFMGPWLANNNERKANDTYMNGLEGYKQEPGSLKSLITLSGYTWYNYSSFRKNYNPTATSIDTEVLADRYFIKDNKVYYSQDTECKIYDIYGNMIDAEETRDQLYKSKALTAGQLYIIQLLNAHQVNTIKVVLD